VPQAQFLAVGGQSVAIVRRFLREAVGALVGDPRWVDAKRSSAVEKAIQTARVEIPPRRA
jgi:hypothetical protein